MKVIKTGFQGLLLIELRSFTDDRGFFYESWHDIDYQKIGVKEKFIQDNVSGSKKNVLRGLHFQKNQGQLVTVIYGKIFDVVVDIRENSKTYKQHFSIELEADNSRQLYMPPGFAHGFCVLSDFAMVHYKSTQYYDPSKEGGIIWNDPTFSIEWPIENPILSLKDANADRENKYLQE